MNASRAAAGVVKPVPPGRRWRAAAEKIPNAIVTAAIAGEGRLSSSIRLS